MPVNNKVAFAISGSFRDSIYQSIPLFHRPSPIYLERVINGSSAFEVVESFMPAFYADDASFLIEPEGLNLLTWPQDAGNSAWIKGSNVDVRTDAAIAPDGTQRADRITWTGGTQSFQQVIKRTINLLPARDYILSFYGRLSLSGSKFGPNDVIRVTGGVAGGSAEVKMNQLNSYPGLYRCLELPFRSAGTIPVGLAEIDAGQEYPITAVTATTATISFGANITADQIAGCRIAFSSTSNMYTVVSNTASSGGQVTCTFDSGSNLAADGVTNATKAFLSGPSSQAVTIEFYSESTVSIDWGIVDLKEGWFRTSPIPQTRYQTLRSDTTLIYPKSPFAGLPTFGVFIDLRYWRGDGPLLQTLGFVTHINREGKLQVQLDSTIVTLPDVLPEKARIFIQVAAESTSLKVYVNGILKATAVVGQTTLPESPMSFMTDGVRAYRQVVSFHSLLTDGGVAVGETVREEVAELYSKDLVLSASDISSQSAGIQLPTVDVPGVQILGSSAVSSINNAATPPTVTVEDGSTFAAGTTVFILRDSVVRGSIFVKSKAANVLSVDSTVGVKVGDLLVYGDLGNPGRATVRLPVEAKDPQIVESIDAGNKRIVVGSTLSFVRAGAYVQGTSYNDKPGVIITNIDDTTRTLTLDDVSGIAVGDYIFQVKREMLIDPQNYSVRIVEGLAGITIATKSRDTIEITNRNASTLPVTPLIIVNL